MDIANKLRLGAGVTLLGINLGVIATFLLLLGIWIEYRIFTGRYPSF